MEEYWWPIKLRQPDIDFIVRVFAGYFLDCLDDQFTTLALARSPAELELELQQLLTGNCRGQHTWRIVCLFEAISSQLGTNTETFGQLLKIAAFHGLVCASCRAAISNLDLQST